MMRHIFCILLVALVIGCQSRRTSSVQNTSSRTWVVTRYEVSCECVTPEFDRRPLKPGEEIPFSVRFDSRGEHGWQMKLLKLYASGSEEPLRIYIEAVVD